MIQIQKTKDKVILSLTTELDYEDVQDLVLDLQSWLIENQPLPKFTGISEEKVKEAWDYSKSKAYIEAKEQNESKNKLTIDVNKEFDSIFDDIDIKSKGNEKAKMQAKAQNDSKNKLASDMRRCYVDLLDSEWLQKELTTYELDPKDRAIIVKKTKLKDERKKR